MNRTNDKASGACHPGEKGKDYMKTQRITKNGAAIGSAVALLLISVLLAPSPALARGSDVSNAKLEPTGVEAGASGQVHVTGEWSSTIWGFYLDGTATVTCRGLTPAETYTLVVTEVHVGTPAGTGSAVASESGNFKVTCRVFTRMDYPPFNSFYIQVVNAGGQIVLEGAFHIPWNHF